MISNKCVNAFVLSYRPEVVRFWRRTLHEKCSVSVFSNPGLFTANIKNASSGRPPLVILDCAGISKEDERHLHSCKGIFSANRCFYLPSPEASPSFISYLEKTKAVPLPFPCDFSLVTQKVKCFAKNNFCPPQEPLVALPTPLCHFLGTSPHAEQIRKAAFDFGKTNIPLILYGESGTGKTFLAELIHRSFARSQKPFYRLNIPNIQEEIAEAELFGTVPGAFTGAKSQGGVLQEANGGTILFDEISEIPLKIQTKLLKFLDSGTFCKVGSPKEHRVNVRIICATNMNLQEFVATGKIRNDFFQRIKGKIITIEPLRTRPQDIADIAQDFIKKKYFGKRSFSACALELLTEQSWPGNIRELLHCLTLTCEVRQNQLLTADDVIL